MQAKQVCSTTHVFHYTFNPNMDTLESFLSQGIRPLSDFPDSERWKQLEEHMPGFYENLYKMMAEPVIKKPYRNSGIYVTPIDFRLLPGTFLHDKPCFRIPLERLDPEWTVATYVIDDNRVSLPLSEGTMDEIARLWDEEMVRKWFAIDSSKVFFYVPQVAVFQGRIDVTESDYDRVEQNE